MHFYLNGKSKIISFIRLAPTNVPNITKSVANTKTIADKNTILKNNIQKIKRIFFNILTSNCAMRVTTRFDIISVRLLLKEIKNVTYSQ